MMTREELAEAARTANVVISLPRDTAQVVFSHMNGDDGWRGEIADRLVRADGRDSRSKVSATELRTIVTALGILSARIAGALSSHQKETE